MQLLSGSFSAKTVLPFTYGMTVTLGATIGASNTGAFTCDTDSWFELWYISASSSLDADDDVMPNNFTAVISEQSSGRALSNQAIPQRVLASPANPFMRQMRPVVFAPSTTIQALIANTVASANNVSLFFVGFKLYKI